MSGSIRIRVLGGEYWLLADSLEDEGAVAYLHQCDDDGQLALHSVFEVSFAHWRPWEGLNRFDQIIAQAEDIEIVEAWNPLPTGSSMAEENSR